MCAVGWIERLDLDTAFAKMVARAPTFLLHLHLNARRYHFLRPLPTVFYHPRQPRRERVHAYQFVAHRSFVDQLTVDFRSTWTTFSQSLRAARPRVCKGSGTRCILQTLVTVEFWRLSHTRQTLEVEEYARTSTLILK